MTHTNKAQETRDRDFLSMAGLRIREKNGKPSRTIEGYAILFNTQSAPLCEDEDTVIYERIAPSAVTRQLLDSSDIKMTMFHDRQLILARSNKGKGTLSYRIDQKGVFFSFDAPRTTDGDKALELVRRGDLAGCSFMFSTKYFDESHVIRSQRRQGGKTVVTYTVKRITGIYDFTLAADPAYPDTTVEARQHDLVEQIRKDEVRKQVNDMRNVAAGLTI